MSITSIEDLKLHEFVLGAMLHNTDRFTYKTGQKPRRSVAELHAHFLDTWWCRAWKTDAFSFICPTVHSHPDDSWSCLPNLQKPQFLEEMFQIFQIFTTRWLKELDPRAAPLDCQLKLVTTEVVVNFVTFKKIFHLHFISSREIFEGFNQVTPDLSLA